MKTILTLTAALVSLAGPAMASAGAGAAEGGVSSKPPAGCNNPVIGVHYDDAYKTLRQAEDYKPGSRNYYVQELSDRRNEYLLAGISPKFRAEWFSSHKFPEKDQHCFNPIFDAINAAAKKTLPDFKPRGWDKHEGNEDDIIRDIVKKKHPGTEIMQVGTRGSWEIAKFNNGIPKNRWKYGMAWVKGAEFDDGYCRIVHVNILQDYSGGGSYADSKGVYINAIPSACK
jgi:hypothetical protein